MSIRLSKNFTLEELEHSNMANRHDIDNSLPDNEYEMAKKIATKILQPLRNVSGPIQITSGYRSHALNIIVKGVSSSQHVYSNSRGAACDIVSLRGLHTTIELVQKIIDLNLPYDQMILEYPESNTGGWVHVSCAGEEKVPRKELLVKCKGKGYERININNEYGIQIYSSSYLDELSEAGKKGAEAGTHLRGIINKCRQV